MGNCADLPELIVLTVCKSSKIVALRKAESTSPAKVLRNKSFTPVPVLLTRPRREGVKLAIG